MTKLCVICEQSNRKYKEKIKNSKNQDINQESVCRTLQKTEDSIICVWQQDSRCCSVEYYDKTCIITNKHHTTVL